MKFCSLSSGSSGNCEYIEYKNTKILIDCGLSGKRTKELLDLINIDINDIDGIFVTHEHLDHVKGVGVLARKYNLNIFATKETFVNMSSITKEIKAENVFLFENEKPFIFKDLYIDPYKSSHDCANGSCFSIIGNKKISIITDTGIVTDNILKHMEDSSVFFIEANHDYEMLINGIYPWHLKQRILSNVGHLSNENSGEILKRLLKKNNEKVILAHLSSDNNYPEKAFDCINDYLKSFNINEGIDYFLEIAPRKNLSKIYEL